LHFKKKTGIFSACSQHNSAQCQSSTTEVSEQDRAQFTHKQKIAASCRIWTILQRWAADFCKLVREIWPNFPQINCGP